MNSTSGQRDGEIIHDAERGKRSRAGWIDADASRNPTTPSDQSSPPDQDPTKGRARDPELENAEVGARSIGVDHSSS